MKSINLHATVRKAVNALHPEVTVLLYRSTGQKTLLDGSIKSVYAPGEAIAAQMQSEGPQALYHANRVGMEEVSRKLYLFCSSHPALRVAGLVRALSRGGDMLFVPNDVTDDPASLPAGSWWLVNAVLEDYTRSGWASVRATLQVNPPDFSASTWWKP